MTEGERGPWFVPVLVALIATLGTVAAAVLPRIIDNDSEPAPTSTATTVDAVPDITGRYSMDGSSRILVIDRASPASFDIAELAGPWPFTGRVTWEDGTFEGPARFDSGDEMTVILRPIGQGKLAAQFDIVSVQGDSRTDKHTLVPVG